MAGEVFLFPGSSDFVEEVLATVVDFVFVEFVLVCVNEDVEVDDFEEFLFEGIELLESQAANSSIVSVGVVKVVKVLGGDQ